jgi:hypothetical protein
MNYTNIKILLILTIAITSTMSFDCNMFPIIKKLFSKDICYNKNNKNYVSRGDAIRNRRTRKTNYKMTNTNNNLNLRNTTNTNNVSTVTLEYNNYLNNGSPSSNN